MAVVSGILAVGGLVVAPSASADITQFSTTIVSGVGRAQYTWTAPGPATGERVRLSFTSTTNGTVWVFGLSDDVATTTTGTVTFNPRSMISSACTMCIVSRISGPDNYLPNDVYATSMSFLNSATPQTTTTSGSSTLTTSMFAMPATMNSPASNSIAGANSLSMSATAPAPVKTDSVSPYTYASRFLISGTGACAGKLTSILLVNPSANVPINVSVDYASTPNITSSVAIRAWSGDALVRGCTYDVSFLWVNSLMYPPLPSAAQNTPLVTTTVTGIQIPTVPVAASGVAATATGSTTATVSWTPGSNGGLALTGQTVTINPGNRTVAVGGSATSAQITGLTDGVAYTFTVSATNAAGTSAESGSAIALTDRCLDAAGAGVNWSACSHPSSALAGATLTNANLSNGNLSGSNLAGANLTGANLAASNLSTANLTGANLTNANLSDADLSGATLTDVTSGGTTGNSGTVLPTHWVLASGSLITIPGAPTAPTATDTDGASTVAWTAPAFAGYGSLTGYTATATPGGAFCSTTGALTCVITGLTNGVTYSISITASTAAGDGPAVTTNVALAARSSAGGGSSAPTTTAPVTSTSQLSQPETTPVVRTPTSTQRPAHFAVGSFRITPELSRALDEQLTMIPRGSALMITASVNPRGSAADRRLARKRAQSVKAYLKAHGVSGPISIRLDLATSKAESRRVTVSA